MGDHLLRNRGVFAVGSLKIIPPTAPDRKWITMVERWGTGLPTIKRFLQVG